MEDLIRPIYQERASHRNTLGILMIEKKFNNSAITDTFDVVLLVIAKKQTVRFSLNITHQKSKRQRCISWMNKN